MEDLDGSPLLQWIFKAIDEDYLLFIGVTSQAQGKMRAVGLPFGMGKSTLALWLNYYVYKILFDRLNRDTESYDGLMRIWDCVFENLFLEPRELDQYVFGPRPVEPPIVLEGDAIPIVAWDDMQETVGKHNRYDPYLKDLAFRFTKGREWVKVVVGTFPMLDALFKWYRVLFHMELIIPRRGTFEFQRTLYTRKFLDWEKTVATAWYESEGKRFGFPDLPPEVRRHYRRWVKKQHARIDEQRRKQYEQPLEPSPPLPQSERSKVGKMLADIRWGNQ